MISVERKEESEKKDRSRFATILEKTKTLLNYIQLAENYVLISVGNLFFSHVYAN